MYLNSIIEKAIFVSKLAKWKSLKNTATIIMINILKVKKELYEIKEGLDVSMPSRIAPYFF
jgi:hypothetical protein